MAIKHTIAKLEDVDEGFRAHYKAVDPADLTKGFVLDIDGAPAPEDTGALKRALERVKQENAEMRESIKAKGGSSEELEALRKSHEAIVKGLNDKIKAGEVSAREAFHKKTVTELAVKLAGENAPLLEPHIHSRIVIEAPDGTNLVRVLGKDGKASALSLDDLVNEFKAEKLYAPILQAGRASGSGTPGGGSNNGGAGGGSGEKAKLPANATPAQKVEWLRQQNTPGYTPE